MDPSSGHDPRTPAPSDAPIAGESQEGSRRKPKTFKAQRKQVFQARTSRLDVETVLKPTYAITYPRSKMIF
jgi:hypothetical protein